MTLDAGSRSPATGGGWRRRHVPVGVFLVVFGLTRVASLLDWSSRHHDAAQMLGVGDGATTALLGVSAVAELLFTVAAVLAVGRRRAVWLLVALAGWLLEFLVLAVVAGVAGDRLRLVEHGVFLLVFGGLFAVTYRSIKGTPAAVEPAPPVPALALPALAGLVPAGSPAAPEPPRPAAPDRLAQSPEWGTSKPGRGAPKLPGALALPQPPEASQSPSATLAGPVPESPDAPEKATVRPAADATRQDIRIQRRDAYRTETDEPAGDADTDRAEADERAGDADHRGTGPGESDVTRRDLTEPPNDRDRAKPANDDARRDVTPSANDDARRDVTPSANDDARRDVTLPASDTTRRDLPEPSSDATHQDLAEPASDRDRAEPASDSRDVEFGKRDAVGGATRADIPVRTRDAEPQPAAEGEAEADETMFDRDEGDPARP
ncbi:hypothetical protein [Actinoallomurus sp. NPDC050550]|uniref:hypothetical protein n=1 Tax=Actinoallomurus sp. NPDC050550 TaxID=3154937 RepID=UPI0033ED1D29